MIHNEISQILYVPVIFNGGHLDIAALDLVTNRDAASFKSAILSHMQTAVLRINALLSMDATVEVAGMFTNLQQLMEDAMTLPAMHPDFAEPEPTDGSIQENVRLAEERKQFLGFVGAGNIEALPGQYENILNEAIQGSLPIQLTKNMLIELFSSLCCKLNEMNLPIDKITSRTFSYETILRLNSNRDLLRWGLSLLKDISSYVRSHADAEPTIIQIAKEYVVNHFDKEISLETAASHVYLSSDYFGKLFKQHTGSSFTDFVVEVRINKALEYLQDPQFKIYEIGSIVGYKNTKYFFKLFKKQTGYTPTEYRRHSINKDKR
jgi:two-component system response regulator YesN